MTSSSKFLSEETTVVFANNDTYSPQNYNKKYANKEITMAAALSYSDNIYAVKTHLFLGEDMLVKTAKRMGIEKDLPTIPSLPLGTAEISMWDFANAYTTLASNGYKKDLGVILKVTDMHGNILYEKKNNSTQVLNSNYTFILNEMLTATYNSAFIDYNTPTIISLGSKISRKYAMKTGSSGTDCYMIGYNPDILMLVWNGYDDNRQMNPVDGNISKNIWVNTVEEYLKDKEISCVVGTSTEKDMAKNMLKNLGILDYFTEVYSGTQVKSPKPAPDIFLLCLGDYAKEESFIFEDSHNGARAGIASGIDTIIVEDVALITAEDRKEAFAVIKQLDEAIKFI